MGGAARIGGGSISDSEPVPELGRSALEAIAGLCARSLPDPPDRDELAAALFGVEQPAVVRGDPDRGVVATVTAPDGGDAFVRLLAVDPRVRRQGLGRRLVLAAEGDAVALGRRRLTIGADAPFFLWPGVPATSTAMLCLLERLRYNRAETNFDMTVELDDLPEAPAGPHGSGPRLAGPDDRAGIDEWMATHWANWRAEVLRAADKGNLLIDEDGGALRAVCAFEVNRRGFLGPVAVRPDLLGHGAGRAVLLAALHELRRRGRTSVDVVWVGPVRPYARVGGRVSNVYFVYRKDLA
jgi:predicted N-acetyltransferase YhbS